MALACAAAVVFCAASLVMGAYMAGIAPFDLLRDPANQFGFPVYGGVISNLSVSVLTLSAAVAGFAAIFGTRKRTRFTAAALLSAILAVDDQYMLHEYVGPKIIGVPEVAFFALYALVGLAIAWSIGRRLLLLRHATLLLAGLGLALSIAIDLLLPMSAYTVLVEELAKLGGLVIWLVYWAVAAARVMSSNETDSMAQDARPRHS